MAMIKCPECEKEVSSFAPTCPNCGFPLNQSTSSSVLMESNTERSTKKKTKGKVIGILFVIIALVGTISYFVYDYLNRDEKTYIEAENFANQGEYKQAYDLLMKIPEYEKTNQLLVNIYYETRFFEGFNGFVKYAKNPNSLTIIDVKFYENSWVTDEANPDCVVIMSGQNGFGGYANSYSLFTCENDVNYEYYGSCDEPNMGWYESSSESEYMTSNMIGFWVDKSYVISVGEVNLDRINEIVTNKKYTNITMIDEFKFETIKHLIYPETEEVTNDDT